MRREEQQTPGKIELGVTRRNYALWYLRKDGDRYYVRLTLTGLLVAVVLTVIPIVILVFFFFINHAQQSKVLENINVNITPTSPSNANYLTIKPPPPSRPSPKVCNGTLNLDRRFVV